MAQTKCPHCGFLNFAISAYCGRCERPLRVETPTVVTNTPSEATIRAMPPRAPKTGLVAPPTRPPQPNVHEEKTVIAPMNLLAVHDEETVIDKRPEHLRVPDAAKPRQTPPTAAELAKEARDAEAAIAARRAERAQIPGPQPTARQPTGPRARDEPTRTANGRAPGAPNAPGSLASHEDEPVEKTVIDSTFLRPTLKIPEEPAFTRDKPEAPSPASLFERLTPKVEVPKADARAGARSEAKTEAPRVEVRTDAATPQKSAARRASTLEDLAGPDISAEKSPSVERAESLSMRETVRPDEVRDILRADPKVAERAVRVQATTVNFDPSAPTQMTASSPALWQVAASTALDAALVLLVGLSIATAEMLVFDVHWPAEAQGLDALAIYLHIYPGTAIRALGGMVLFAFVYNVVGAHLGRTVGRALLGLRLVKREGVGVSWVSAVIRGVFSLVSIGFFGAGYFWMLMDTQHRTWGDLAARAVVVRR